MAVSAHEQSLRSLVTYIVDKHHVYTREAFAELGQLLDEVSSAHGEQPDLARLKSVFGELRADLVPHLMKEEQVLFPYIGDLVQAREEQRSWSMPPFGTAQNPIRMMRREHDDANSLLCAMRDLMDGSSLVDCDCADCRRLYAGLKAFDEDLMEHMHLENDVLFPKVLALEVELMPSISTR